MTYFLWHVSCDPTGNWLGLLDEEHDDRYKLSPLNNYRLRSVDTNLYYPFFELWPSARFSNNDANLIVGSDNSRVAGGFERVSVTEGGNWHPGYFNGQCTLSDGTPLASAVVVLALTATDQYVSSGITDPNGSYSLPTNFLGQNHYIYANYANGTYVGGSINTLTPNG